MTSPHGEVIEQPFRLDFVASNNEAEYEALIAGLRLVTAVRAKQVHAYCNSQLVANQYSGEYETRDERMEAYSKVVKDLAAQFKQFSLTPIWSVSLRDCDHVGHLQECFKVLNKYQMKLNPAKCSFGVSSGKFLGYLVTQRGIEANSDQQNALREMPSPRNRREVQRLTGRIAALNRFISRSTDKCLPFYQLLKGNKKLEWDEKCEKTFKELKEYLSTTPILAKPLTREPLYLYVAVSQAAVSGVLVREEQGNQRPIFYVSKSLVDAET